MTGLVTGLLLGVAPAAPASAATAPCVGVLVDARLLGGTVHTSCALGNPRSGLAALTKAGFHYTLRPRDGLVCQLDAQPGSCTDTTASSYWSYWYRAPGAHTWVYANQGPATHDPAPGSTEAWVWQSGGRRAPPDVALTTICPQAASPAPKPKPSATRTAKPAPKPPTSTRPSRSAAATTAATTKRPKKAPTRSRPTASATTGTPTPAPSDPDTTDTAAATPTAPQASPVAEPSDGEGGLPRVAGVVVGGLVAAGLGVAAFARTRRGQS